MKNKLLGVLIFFALQLNIFGNGGPVDGSLITGTGHIKLITKENVSLDKEFLFISFNGDYANVLVKYTLTNHGKNEKITYAFPINIVPPNYDINQDIKYDDCIPYFTMRLNNSLVENIQVKIDSVKSQEGGYGYYKYTKWYIGTIDLKNGNPQQLEISYKVKMDFEDSETSKSHFFEYGYRNFFYDFSPASNWGNGKVKDFQLIINSSDVIANGDSIVNFQVPGNQKFSAVYDINLTDCDLKALKPINIEINSENSKRTMEYESRLRPNLIKNANCSSRDNNKEFNSFPNIEPPYSLRNLFDNNFNTAWYETGAGNGVGEVLTFYVDHKISVFWIGLVNGFTKSKETYYNNSRVKKLKIEFFASEADSSTNSWAIRELPDRRYENLNKRSFANFMDVISDKGESASPVGKIKITILEIYSGQKFKDLCISELFIGGGYTSPND